VSLPEITDEDRAVAEEALRVFKEARAWSSSSAEIAAALIRTKWKRVDQDLILAREVCASRSPMSAAARGQYLAGVWDGGGNVALALAAIKAAVQRERKG